MVKRVLISSAVIFLLCSARAFADPAAVAKAHSDAFAEAFAACDVPAVLDLYEDDAAIIWPGQGEEAKGKAAIEKVVRAGCSGAAKPDLKPVSADSRAVGKNYVINVGQWDDTAPGPDGKPVTMRVRTTELLHKSGGKWRYVVDHASVGLPPPPPAKAEKSAAP